METNKQGYVNTEIAESGLTTISFFHPAQNSLPGYLLKQLSKAIHQAGLNDQTKVILLKSDGNMAFCAGASFHELLAITTKEQGAKFFSGFAHVINACRTSSKVIIGRVHGKAIGGGVGIAAAADHCFATTQAAIKLSELTIGIGPFVIGPAVTRKMGLSAFSQVSLNASEFYSAEWAKENGLFADVFDTPDEMDIAISTFIQKMLTWSPDGLSAFKKTLWEGTENWDAILTRRAEISGELVLSEFARDAIGKLKPNK